MKIIFTTSILTALVMLGAFIIYPPVLNQAQKVVYFKNLNEKKQALKIVSELEKIKIATAVPTKTNDSLKAVLANRTELLEKAQREYLGNVAKIKKQNAELKAQNLELRKYVNRSFQAAKMDVPKDFGNGSQDDYVVTSLKDLKPIPKVIHDTIYIYKTFFESLFKRKKR